MKLSELTYSYLCSVGLSKTYMPTDATDSLTTISSEDGFERAKAELFEKYGDVTVVVTPDADWFDRIKIDDAKWQEDFDKFCADKAAWCSKYGCD